jgi:cytochrome b561
MTAPRRYHPVLVALHWGLAALIIADLAVGSTVLVHIPNAAPRKLEGLRAHMSGGLVILAAMTIRLGVRLTSTAPAAAPTGSPALDRLAWLSHRALYGAVFVMALSGFFLALQSGAFSAAFRGEGALPASFWIYPLRTVHFAASRLLMGLIALHLAGALFHTLVRRDGLLARMSFGRRDVQPAE